MRYFQLLGLVLAFSQLSDAGQPDKLPRRKSPSIAAVEKVRPALVTVNSAVAEKKDATPPDFSPRPRQVLAPLPILGVIVDPKGIVLAPYHAQTKLEVILAGGTKLPAKVLLADSKLGVLLLKVEPGRPLPHAEFGDSDKVEVGDSAVAVALTGSFPGYSVQQVIVSATHKKLPEIGEVLQVDSSVGPGLNRGPLIDLQGKLLGLVTRDGGIGFAIPSNRLKELVSRAVTVAPQAPKTGKLKELPKREWADPDRGEPNGTSYRTFRSKILERDVSYLVYLPPGYAEQKERYPVIYWLHGLNGTQRSGATAFVPHLDEALKKGKLPSTIVVLVNGMGFGAYCDSADGKRPIESVIVKDVIPHVDQTYRTLARREGRVIQGYSMGGYGAGHLGFKYPELFGTVIVDAGALVDNKSRRPEEHPGRLARGNADKLRGKTLIRIGVGAKDDLRPANQELHELLQQLKIEHEYQEVPDVDHNGVLYYRTLGTSGFEFHKKCFAKGDGR